MCLRRHHKRDGRYVSFIKILVTDEEKQVFINTKKFISEICLKVLVKKSRGSVRSIFAFAFTIRLRQFAISIRKTPRDFLRLTIFFHRIAPLLASRWLLCSLCLLSGHLLGHSKQAYVRQLGVIFKFAIICSSVWQGSDDQKILMHSKRFVKHPLTGTKLG